MRVFEYNYNDLEVTIKVLSESSTHICDAKFPTPASAVSYAIKDIDWHFSNCSQPPLTDSEKTNLINLVTEKTQ